MPSKPPAGTTERRDPAKKTDCLSFRGPELPVAALFLFLSSVAWAGPKHYDIRFLINEAHPFERFSSSKLPAASVTPLREWAFLADTRPESVRPTRAAKAVSANQESRLVRRSKKRREKITSYKNEPQPIFNFGPEGPRLQFGIGYFDVTDDWGAAEFRIEWHGKAVYKKIRPLAGVMATSNGAQYGYGGLVADFEVSDRFVFSPSFAPGIYVKSGSAKKLGHWIEFRSMAELSYRLDSGGRLGLAVYHLSNASLDEFNPGTEVISVSYTLPLNSQFF